MIVKATPSPKIFFQYVLVIVGVLLAAYGAETIVAYHIEKLFPDPDLNPFRESWQLSKLRGAISALLVGIPVLVIAHKMINRSLRLNRYDANHPVRRWMLYIVLLIAGLIIIDDLAGIVNNYLSGQNELQQYLKALCAIAISAVIFSFYCFDLKRSVLTSKAKMRMVAYPLALAMLAVAASGVLVIPTPHQAFLDRMDQNRIRDLSELKWTIERYADKHKQLPARLLELVERKLAYSDQITDPESGVLYGYQILAPTKYKLCASFRSSTEKTIYGPEWQHKAGEECFEMSISLKLLRKEK